ncbi:MAG: T9SS type A sorting domain-containing protein, partial [Candidatus Cloacimonadaceae bacterium]
AGVYALSVPVGCHSVTASAAGFGDQTVEDVLVEQDLTATVNFVLDATSVDDPRIPVTATALSGNYPNPFNPETTISYSVKEPGMVRIEIYNIKGQLVRTLVDEAHATGHYKQTFDARDDRGRNISNGVYLIRMRAPGYHKMSKMILMK